MLPINAFTSSNISFNASITYSHIDTKPVITEVEIKDSEGTILVTCSDNAPCSFRNTFAERALRVDSGDHNLLDTLLIVVQDASLNDTGSYSLAIEYFRSDTSVIKQEYTGTVDVNVNLTQEGK